MKQRNFYGKIYVVDVLNLVVESRPLASWVR